MKAQIVTGRTEGGGARIGDIRATLRRLYARVPFEQRLLSVWRPSICPFHMLMEHVPHGTSMLDVGCGSGVFLNLLADEGRIARGVGIDASLRAIAAGRAAHRGVASGVSVEFHQRSVDDGLPEGRYGVVSLIDVLHHIPPASQRGALELAASRVAAGGLLLFKDVGPRPRWRAWASRLHDLVIARQWIHIVAPSAVEAWMEAIGFEIVHRQTIDMLWYGHELLVFRNAVGQGRAGDQVA